ncbi:DUF4250 domain-containing protein [Faecalicatena contorta]|uniref:DUF4250 domain-containing protein n=1 Tax=Faecalicatena contorta TaxID=39482 RepID=A0A316A5Y9_9FIRM|nr:DUF4250 domain-containing protein [Faecalicatena contorta]PWJ52380.1 uncharacterized protein DUF4250 [Faecalicatena contorta]SUQ12658.1 protein of unknown function [Faecalicatena contorta]
MLTRLPGDPVILLSVINTRLRDYYKTLDELCEDMEISQEELTEKLKTIDYEYNAARNQFI